jgi:hypothetical protein
MVTIQLPEKIKAYNKSVYWPGQCEQDTRQICDRMKKIKISLTGHAFQRINEKNIDLSRLVGFDSSHIIEIYYMLDGLIQKFLIRKDNTSFIITWAGCIVTSWNNNENDNHSTINMNMYERN